MRSSTHLRITSPLLLGVLLAVGCADAPPEPAAEAQAAPEFTVSLETATALDVRNARMPMPGLITAGQVTEEQFDALVDAGFENFISLRLADENGAGWEEEHTVGGSTSFTRIPISGAADLNRETVAELAHLLDEASEEGTVLYCGSSNRVGALMALKAFWMDGATAEEALVAGRAAGMTRMESAVVEILEAEGN
jgi:protein tyrosine phosphatase (PTP) superfamily phosphohydrolase (DUF442 family)